MSQPDHEKNDISKSELEERAEDILENGEFVTFSEHNEQREQFQQ